MKKRCTPCLVREIHEKDHSWRLAAKKLNAIYGVNLSHLIWMGYGSGKRKITNPKTRESLLLRPRITCRNKPRQNFSHLLKRMTDKDLQIWHELRRKKKYKAAFQFLEEIFNRKIKSK